MINSPCYGCQIRTTRCHTDCEKYLAYKSKCDNRRAERSKNYDFFYYVCHKIDIHTRFCKVKDCVLVEREIYTALTEKECNKCG